VYTEENATELTATRFIQSALYKTVSCAIFKVLSSFQSTFKKADQRHTHLGRISRRRGNIAPHHTSTGCK